MPAPHEILAASLNLWVAPTGTAFPAVNVAPGGSFFQLGTSGNKNYDDGGVTVTHNQSIDTFTGAGGTAARKAFRTAQGLVLGFTLVDLTPEQYAKILDDAAVTTVGGAGGHKDFSLMLPVDVKQLALLARGPSSVDNSLVLQYEWPTVYQSAEPAPVFQKGTPAGLAVEYTAIEAVAGQFGTIRVQTAA